MKPDDALAAEYTLGLLDDAARDRVERRISGEPALAAEIAFWDETFSELDGVVEPIPVDDALWTRIQAELPRQGARVFSREKQGRTSGLWESLAFWRLGAFGAATAAALAVTVWLAFPNAAEKPVYVAVLLTTERSEPGALVQTFADGRTVLIPLNVISVPSDRSLQVWTLPSVQRGPVPIGLLRETRSADLSLDAAPAQAQLFEITLEPAAGSPTGRPTGPILMKGFANQTF